MKPANVIKALRALAHEKRLVIYRLLVARCPDGMAAGDIATRVGIEASSLTFHVQVLLHAGLVTQHRDGRHLYYAASATAMNMLVAYLTENCCGKAVSCDPVCTPQAQKSKVRRTSRKTN